MPSPNQITVPQLARLLGTPSMPVLIDVRIDEDADAHPGLLPTARRCHYDDVDALLAFSAGAPVVVYCHKGRKLSQGAAALMRNAGVTAEVLEGGWVAWQQQGWPVVPPQYVPADAASDGSLWVTRQRPKVDRVACAWLIRRFVDRQARFLMVPTDDVVLVAERFDATPFDVDNVFFTHRGEHCTFDTMLEEFGLQSAALQQLALMVRAADTDRLELVAQAAGLLAASLGLSRMYRDDLQQVEAGLALYDAFYRWARDATDETHSWPHATGEKSS